MVEVRDKHGLSQELGDAQSQVRPDFLTLYSAKQHDWETDAAWSDKDVWSSIITPRSRTNFVGVRDEGCNFDADMVMKKLIGQNGQKCSLREV